ncbi:MAG: hypothetical protein DRJ11_11210, partial [Candidatus Aminicenantes bacterium]
HLPDLLRKRLNYRLWWHATWPIDRDYMASPAFGKLVKLNPALIVMLPPGLEVNWLCPNRCASRSISKIKEFFYPKLTFSRLI